MVVSNLARSWLYMIPLIPSILVSLFNLYHFLKSRALRQALNNHVIILLLSCGLLEEITDISWQIHYYRTGRNLSETYAFCLVWSSLCSAVYISNFTLMAWASIERHILIFYPNWFGTKIKRFFFHYLPLMVCILWPVAFYCSVFFIVPCPVQIDYNISGGGLYTCLIRLRWASLTDSIANYFLPSFVSVIFSMALFARVIWHRYRIRGRIDWRNYKKMALQLFPISTLYIVLQFPPMLLYAAYSAGLSRTVGVGYYNDGLYFSGWTILLTPFAASISIPDVGTKYRKLIFFWRPPRTIQPETLAMTRRNVGQTVVVKPAEKTQVVVAERPPQPAGDTRTVAAQQTTEHAGNTQTLEAPKTVDPADNIQTSTEQTTQPETTTPKAGTTGTTTLMTNPSVGMPPVDI